MQRPAGDATTESIVSDAYLNRFSGIGRLYGTAALEKFLKDFPSSTHKENAMYRIAIVYFLSNKYKETLQWWEVIGGREALKQSSVRERSITYY